VLSLSAPALKELLAQPLPSPAAIVARLVEPAQRGESIAPQTNKAQPPKREVRKPDREKTAPAVSAAVVERAAPTEPQSPTAAEADVPSLPPASAAPARPSADISSIAQYRHQLISSAVRHKRYPPAALDNDWQGDVLVRLSVAASGSVAEVSVKASSGHAQLDEQALEMFRLAAAEVPVPPALRGQEFGFEVRASYELQR